MLSALLLLALYVVVAGWGLAYAHFTYSGAFAAARAVDVAAHFTDFMAEINDGGVVVAL